MSDARADLIQGTLDLLALKALALGRMHGWGIQKRIEQLSEDALRVQQGSLYPALLRLQQSGWITAEWGVSEKNRRAKYYSLTTAGREQLGAETETWERLAAGVFRVLGAESI